MWRPGARHRTEFDRERLDARVAGIVRGLERRAPQRQHDHGLVGEGEVHGDLAAVAAPGRDRLAALHRKPEDIGREARAETRGDRRPEGHAGRRMADQHQPRLPRFGDGADRLLVERGIEVRIGLRDGDDLVHALAVGGVGERVCVLRDDEDAQRPADALLDRCGSADHLQRDIPEGAVEVLGHDENAGHHPSPRLSRMMSAMALATAAASPSIIAARPDLGGSYSRRMTAPA